MYFTDQNRFPWQQIFFSRKCIVIYHWKAFLKWNKKLVNKNELATSYIHFKYLPNQGVCLKRVGSKFSILNN